jgi:hypothetical protein
MSVKLRLDSNVAGVKVFDDGTGELICSFYEPKVGTSGATTFFCIHDGTLKVMYLDIPKSGLLSDVEKAEFVSGLVESINKLDDHSSLLVTSYSWSDIHLIESPDTLLIKSGNSTLFKIGRDTSTKGPLVPFPDNTTGILEDAIVGEVISNRVNMDMFLHSVYSLIRTASDPRLEHMEPPFAATPTSFTITIH